MRTALIVFITQRVALEDGPLGCPETSVRNYLYLLRNNPEERISYLLRGGSLNSRMCSLVYGSMKVV
jgi:hypothetical protein